MKPEVVPHFDRRGGGAESGPAAFDHRGLARRVPHQSRRYRSACAGAREPRGVAGRPSSCALGTAALSGRAFCRRGRGSTHPVGARPIAGLLKLGRFEAARALADSLLTDVSRASPTSAVALAGAAVLTGRPSQAASLLGRGASTVEAQAPDGTPIAVTPALRETWLELLAYASVGAPEDSLTALEGRMQGQVKSYIAPDRQAEVNHVLLHQVHSLEYHAVGATSSHRAAAVADPLLRLQRMAMQGDKAGVRRQMDEVGRLRRSGTPGDVALDATLGEARVRLSIGDTAAATSQLDQVLDALPTLGVALLGDVPQGSIPQAAALPQVLALRAELAAHAGDSTVARARAAQALALWGGAEPALASQVSRLRDLAAGH